MADRVGAKILGGPRPRAPRGLALALLAGVFALNFMDRQIVAILSEPIKHEFGLSDAQVGLLYGFAFAVVYGFAGIPIARWADRGDRARIISASLAFFSLMTMACGLAASYAQLLAARVGVAVGEGGTNPSSHSLIADLYPEERRATAMGAFALGPNAGILLGFAFGGAIGQAWGWRAALLSAGAAGLAFAGLTTWLLKDSLRSGARQAPAPPAVGRSLRALFGRRSMRHLFIGSAVMNTAVYAAIGWLPALLIRSHGLGTASAGVVLALLLGGLGAAGTLAGGWLADRLGARNPAWRLRIVALGQLVTVPFWLGALLAGQPATAIAFLAVPSVALCFYLAPTFATVQSLAEPTSRALAAALLILVGSLIGLGLGPLAVGALSDALRPAYGPESLRVALVALVPLLCWSAAHYHAASRALMADLGAR